MSELTTNANLRILITKLGKTAEAATKAFRAAGYCFQAVGDLAQYTKKKLEEEDR